MRKRILCLLITLGVATPLSAHPYFIRLGYSTCTTCHISPQGGSILTAYGQGVERALSLLPEPEQNGEEESPRPWMKNTNGRSFEMLIYPQARTHARPSAP